MRAFRLEDVGGGVFEAGGEVRGVDGGGELGDEGRGGGDGG